jgi:predicted O-linked N-acetylglucosamine transferase (SPINDLY family)
MREMMLQSLTIIRALGNSTDWQRFVQACNEHAQEASDDELVSLANLLVDFGFNTLAKSFCQQAGESLISLATLARLATNVGDHSASRALYERLLAQQPNSRILRSNALLSLQYDPTARDEQRLEQAKSWGQWASGGHQRPRPALKPLNGRPLRVGFVSADLCQHTVGLFLKDVIQALQPERLKCWAYHVGGVSDWLTEELAHSCTLVKVQHLDDAALAALISADAIDVLVDLSGHTAGSRLTVFAQRPAPVQVSWLGYFATTGLDNIDAVLLDKWHAPKGTQAQFIEPILSLPNGRWCYQPVRWAPPFVAPLPSTKAGHITFGCFNNTAKLNAEVFNLWAKVLHAVPASRIILKWRTFNDEAFKQLVSDAFTQRGIEQGRIELRGPSFHADLLAQYADIDIALDPFPFSGGLTSCEALWMGVPVVTWPQSRVVSRQTHAILNQIDLPELSAKDADDYVRIAVELANDRKRLAHLRATLRDRMRASQLMDLAGFARGLEDFLINLYYGIYDKEAKSMTTKTMLHVGPGHRASGAKLPQAFQGADWREIRLDIDPTTESDILGSMLDMRAVEDMSVDAIYSAHNIEHVHTHEVPKVLSEFLRVLKPEGFLVVTCPDLQTVSQLVAEDKLGDAAYASKAGPITPLDIIYGHGQAVAAGHHYMAHKTGFTLKTLINALRSSGFATTAGKRRLRGLDLWVLATRCGREEQEIRAMAKQFLPD